MGLIPKDQALGRRPGSKATAGSKRMLKLLKILWLNLMRQIGICMNYGRFELMTKSKIMLCVAILELPNSCLAK